MVILRSEAGMDNGEDEEKALDIAMADATPHIPPPRMRILVGGMIPFRCLCAELKLSLERERSSGASAETA
jgi:hypothetical protein